MQLAQHYTNIYHQDKALDEKPKRSSLLCHLILDLNFEENTDFKVGGMKELLFNYI